MLVAGFGTEYPPPKLHVTVSKTLCVWQNKIWRVQGAGTSRESMKEKLHLGCKIAKGGYKPRRDWRSFKYPGLGPRGASTVVYWQVRSALSHAPQIGCFLSHLNFLPRHSWQAAPGLCRDRVEEELWLESDNLWDLPALLELRALLVFGGGVEGIAFEAWWEEVVVSWVSLKRKKQVARIILWNYHYRYLSASLGTWWCELTYLPHNLHRRWRSRANVITGITREIKRASDTSEPKQASIRNTGVSKIQYRKSDAGHARSLMIFHIQTINTPRIQHLPHGSWNSSDTLSAAGDVCSAFEENTNTANIHETWHKEQRTMFIH